MGRKKKVPVSVSAKVEESTDDALMVSGLTKDELEQIESEVDLLLDENDIEIDEDEEDLAFFEKKDDEDSDEKLLTTYERDSEDSLLEGSIDLSPDSIALALKRARKAAYARRYRKRQAMKRKKERERRKAEELKKEQSNERNKQLTIRKNRLGIVDPKFDKGKFKQKQGGKFDIFKLSNVTTINAIHVITKMSSSNFYRDQSSITYSIPVGGTGFGNPAKGSVFEHLYTIQEKIKESVDNGFAVPEWIIISSDLDAIYDRMLVSKLCSLQEHTYAAGQFGYSKIKPNGKFWDYSRAELVAGGVARGRYYKYRYKGMVDGFEDYDVNHVELTGTGFYESDRYRVLIVDGPWIAIRTKFFVNLDMTDIIGSFGQYSRSALYHFKSILSLEVLKAGGKCAQITSIGATCSDIQDHDLQQTPEFVRDHAIFLSLYTDLIKDGISL